MNPAEIYQTVIKRLSEHYGSPIPHNLDFNSWKDVARSLSIDGCDYYNILAEVYLKRIDAVLFLSKQDSTLDNLALHAEDCKTFLEKMEALSRLDEPTFSFIGDVITEKKLRHYWYLRLSELEHSLYNLTPSVRFFHELQFD